MAMQYVRGDVGPELAENVGQSVASQSIRIFFGELFAGIALAWIVGRGNSLSDAATQHLGNIESIVAVVFSCNEDASRSVCTALPEPTFSQVHNSADLGERRSAGGKSPSSYHPSCPRSRASSMPNRRSGQSPVGGERRYQRPKPKSCLRR